MAFVIQSDRLATHITPTATKDIGPGAYLGIEEKEINEKSGVPFNTLEKRGENFQLKDVTPGPGSYNIEQPYLNEKVVVSSANEDIKIVEVPKPQAMFKSGTQRFKSKNETQQIPGPGDYNVGQAIAEIKKWPESRQKQDILDKLMQMNKYQSIPSIPSKTHAFGYTENQSNELELNKLPQQIHTGVKQDQIGPTHYVLKDTFENNRNKGTNRWSQNGETRFKYSRKTQSVVGPGQYDVQTQFMPLYKLKPNVGFASKTMRTSDQRKGQIANQFLKQRSIQSSDTTMRTRGGTDFEDDTDSEYEYIEDATPGPGHYNNESIITSIKPQSKQERFQFFGSGQVRFKDKQQISQAGPGDYKGSESSCFKQKQSLKVRKPPFQSSNTRFEIKSIQDQKPGPTTYMATNTLREKIEKKRQKGYRGNFGTTENRFKPNGMEEYPGPGTYLESIKERDEEKGYIFKSKVPKGAFQQSKEQLKKPPVGSYNINYYDIQRQIHKDDEEDEDLKIPYPAFGSSMEYRFGKPQPKIDPDDEDDDYEMYPKDKSITDQYKAKPKQDHRFGSKADRFKYKIDKTTPAPGKYHDNNVNTWNKRTYNIKFAEI